MPETHPGPTVDAIIDAAVLYLHRTNTRLDDAAPIDLLRLATEPAQFAAVRAAARQLVSFEG